MPCIASRGHSMSFTFSIFPKGKFLWAFVKLFFRHFTKINIYKIKKKTIQDTFFLALLRKEYLQGLKKTLQDTFFKPFENKNTYKVKKNLAGYVFLDLLIKNKTHLSTIISMWKFNIIWRD